MIKSNFRLRGVGPQIEKHLARLDIHSPQDLLFHLPARYQDRTQIQLIRQCIANEEAVIEGFVHSIGRPARGRSKLVVELRDASGRLTLRFFHVLSFQLDMLKPGNCLRCYGQIRLGVKGLEMMHPEMKLISEDKPLPIDQYLTPIYPATEGLSQYMLRKLTGNALEWMAKSNELKELLPAAILQPQAFPSLKDALHFVHRPPSDTALEALADNKTFAQKRLVFEELLAHRISLLTAKREFQLQNSAALNHDTSLTQAFLKVLPFQLTRAQQKVVGDINQDLQRGFPMLRLVQGDVGSGKTVVAALAVLQAIANGYQAALMAPTELLAEQHYRVFKRWLEPLAINVVFLSGQVKASERARVLSAVAKGEAQLVLGTHALFQQDVQFAKLALVIIDEQHRFGVHQRALFRDKGKQADFFPHQLIMTATPIPRTLAMSFYADLDCSVIDELPPGRTPIVTTVVANSRRDEVVVRIREACKEKRQVYWVCPLIEESEVLNCQAATATFEELRQCLPELTIGLIHGRMKAVDKEMMMHAFQAGNVDVLVATTVIEVGVDVPNASVMIIENAERLGLSQLHQLRGRVGRGSVASHCVLLFQTPLSPMAKERLAVMRESNDGFKIAQRDLELRGPGELLGTRQTGELSFYMADLLRDSELLPLVVQAAEIVMRDHASIIEALTQRWLGVGKEYGKV